MHYLHELLSNYYIIDIKYASHIKLGITLIGGDEII